MKKIIFTHLCLLLTVLLTGCIDLSTGEGDALNDNVVQQSDTSNTTSGQPQSDRFLEDMVERSDLIFYGTLKGINNEMSIENIPYTFLTYDVHKVIAGRYKGEGDTLTLRFVGGYFPDGRHLSASNSPDVTLNEKSVVIAHKGQDTGCDLVDCEKGRFVVEDNLVLAANKAAIDIGEDGRVTYISSVARKTGAYKGMLDDMSVERFIQHLESLDAKTSDQRKGQRNVVTDAYSEMPFHAYKGLTTASAGPAASNKSTEKGAPDSQSQGSAYDQWEVKQLQANGGNPVLGQSYNGTH